MVFPLEADLPSQSEASSSAFKIEEKSPSSTLMMERPDLQRSGHELSRIAKAIARKPGTKRGRNGKKWVGLNWEHKEILKALNSKSSQSISPISFSYPCL
jgi:hypothetical protein